MPIEYNQPETKHLRRNLRKEMPQCEHILWSRLRARQLNNLKFRRQCGIGSYIADFYCADIMLVIEIDGYSHDSEQASQRDHQRQQYIESLGILVLRFTNNEVQRDIDTVIEQIMIAATEREPADRVIHCSVPSKEAT